MIKASLQSVCRAATIASSRLRTTCALGFFASQSLLRVTTKLNRPGSGSPAKASYVLRPIMTGMPQVVFLKNFISFGRCQSRRLSFPITLLVLAAAIRLMIIERNLHSHPRFDRGVKLIVLQGKIFKMKSKNILDIRIELHHRQRVWTAGQLQFCLFEVVVVQMYITKGVDEFAGFQSAYLCHHQRQQGIGSDVERDAQKSIRTALIQLAA